MFTERVHSRADQRSQTRQRVLEATERLFRQQGFDATTIRQVAAAAEVSTGTVMAMGDKAGLLVEVFDSWIADVHRRRKPVTKRGRKDLVATIIDLFVPFLEYFERDPELSRQYAAVIVRGAHRSRIFEELAVALVSEIEAALVPAGISVGDAAGRARTIYFAYLGVVMTGSNQASAGLSMLDTLRDVVAHVGDTARKDTPK